MMHEARPDDGIADVMKQDARTGAAAPDLPADRHAPRPLRLHARDGIRSPGRDVGDLPGPRAHWLWGNARQWDPDRRHAGFEAWADRYGAFYRVKVAGRDVVCLSDPVLIAEMLRHRPEVFSRPERLSAMINETGAIGLFTAEGERWRRQRKLVMRALSPEGVKGFYPLIQTVTDRLHTRWRHAARAGTTVDVLRDLKCFAVDIATGLAIGEDVNTLEHPEHPLQADIEFWFSLIGKRVGSAIPYWRWFDLAPERRLKAMQRRRDTLIDRAIADARSRLACNPARRSRPSNILEALIVARDAPDSGFTDEDVRGNVMTILFAGEDTVANATAWLMRDLATRPEAAARVRAEVDALLGEFPRPVPFGLLGDFRQIEHAAMESMRLKPIAPIAGMTALQAVDLAGLRVSPGQRIVLLTRVGSRLSGAFPDFDSFDADRWSSAHATGTENVHRNTYAFGAGPRVCPGRQLAMVEMKMIVAMAMRSFDFSTPDGEQQAREHFTFTMGPERLQLRFAERAREHAT